MMLRTLCIFAVIVASGDAETLDMTLKWGPQKKSANVGDQVVFSWSGNHNVRAMSNYKDCTFTGDVLSESSGGYTYTVLEADAGTALFFACAKASGSHCRSGMKIQIDVAPMTVQPTATTPMPAVTTTSILPDVDVKWFFGMPPSEESANVGDQIVFSWTGNHVVQAMSSVDCEFTGDILSKKKSMEYTYTVLEADAGTTLFFGCPIGTPTHCADGMRTTIDVAGDTVVCTEESMECPDGTDMPRAKDCTWLPDQCPDIADLCGGETKMCCPDKYTCMKPRAPATSKQCVGKGDGVTDPVACEPDPCQKIAKKRRPKCEKCQDILAKEVDLKKCKKSCKKSKKKCKKCKKKEKKKDAKAKQKCEKYNFAA